MKNVILTYWLIFLFVVLLSGCSLGSFELNQRCQGSCESGSGISDQRNNNLLGSFNLKDSLRQTGDRQVLIDYVEEDSASLTQSQLQQVVSENEDSLVKFYKTFSGNQLNILPTVISLNSQNIKTYLKSGDVVDSELKRRVEEHLLQQNNIRFSSFDHKVIIVQNYHQDLLGGIGGVGDFDSGVATLNGFTPGLVGRYVLLHEYGHMLGLSHSNLDHNHFSGEVEYADLSSVMGYPSLNGFTAPEMVDLGWLQGSQVKRITQSGTYVLGVLHDSTQLDLPRVLAIPAYERDKSGVVENGYVYLSYQKDVNDLMNLADLSLQGDDGADTGKSALSENQNPMYNNLLNIHRRDYLGTSYFVDSLATNQSMDLSGSGVTINGSVGTRVIDIANDYLVVQVRLDN